MAGNSEISWGHLWKVVNESGGYVYTSLHTIDAFMTWCLIKHRDSFTFVPFLWFVYWQYLIIILKVSKGVPRRAEVALGILGRLRPQIISTFGTTRVVGRQPYTLAAFLPQEKSLVLIFRGWVDLRAHGFVRRNHAKTSHWHHRESIPGPSD